MRITYKCKCPFFQSFVKNGIACEGDDGMKDIIVKFENSQMRRAYFNGKCRNEYKSCLLYKSLMDK